MIRGMKNRLTSVRSFLFSVFCFYLSACFVPSAYCLPQTANFGSHYRTGLAALAQHDLPTAIKELRMAVAGSPKNPHIHNSLGLAYETAGQLGPAVVEYRKAIALSPQFAEAYMNMARTLEKRNDLDGAMGFYRWAAKLRPDWPEAHDALGIVLERRSDFKGASNEFKAAAQQKPDFAPARLHLGLAEFAQNHYEAAAAECREALRLQPAVTEARDCLSLALAQGNKPAGTGNEGDATRPTRPLNTNSTAAANIQGAAPDRQENDSEQANPAQGAGEASGGTMTPASNIALQHYTLGITLWHKGKLDQAESELQSAIRERVDYEQAHYLLGIILAQHGKVNAARRELQAAVELSPSDGAAHQALGRVLQRMGDVAGAQAEFKQPEKPDVQIGNPNKQDENDEQNVNIEPGGDRGPQ